MSKRSLLTALTICLLLLVPSAQVMLVTASAFVEDALGRTVSLDAPPKRVVTLSPAATEILALIDELGRVVGADSLSLASVWYMNASSVLRSAGVADLGGYWWSAVKFEEVVKLEPDLVIADRGAHIPLLKLFEEYGIKVVYLYGGSSRSINDVVFDIYTMATLFGKEESARTFVESLERELERARDALPAGPLRVLVIVGIYDGFWVAGKGTYLDDLLLRLGLENAADTYSWAAVSLEKLFIWNPDVIIVYRMGLDERTVWESGLQHFRDRVCLLEQTEEDILARPGPLLALAPQVIVNCVRAVVSGSEQAPTEVVMPAAQTLAATYRLLYFALGALVGAAVSTLGVRLLGGRSRR